MRKKTIDTIPVLSESMKTILSSFSKSRSLPASQAASFTLSDKTETILKNFSASYSQPSCIVLRSKIILMAAEEKNNTQIAKAVVHFK